MNKTIDISLGGMLFHLDENAYYKLKNYLQSVRTSLLNAEDTDEVMSEIEARIAELLIEKQAHPQQVINLTNINDIINILGQPEDYEETVDNENHNYRVKKGLFRDLDNSFMAGIASGMGHYLGVSPVIMRLIFVILLFVTSGSIILIYLLLWIVIPKAKTASDKLRMKGEKVNLDNLVDQVSIDDEYPKKRASIGRKFEETTHEISNIVVKFIGFIIALTTGAILLSLILSLLTLSPLSDLHISLLDTPFYNTFDMPFGWLNIVIFIIAGFPIAMLFLLGLKLLFPNVKSVGGNVFIVLGTIWFLSLIVLIVKGSSALAHKKENISIVSSNTILPINNDTIFLAVDNKMIVKKKKFYKSRNIDYFFKTSPDEFFHLKIEKSSEGIDIEEATQKVSNIIYKYKIDTINHKLIFSNDMLFPLKDIVQDHEVNIYIYIPENKVVKLPKKISGRHFSYACKSRIIQNINGKINCLGEHNNTDFDDDEKEIRINGNKVKLKIKNNKLELYSEEGKESVYIKVDKNGIKVEANDKDEKKLDSINIKINNDE